MHANREKTIFFSVVTVFTLVMSFNIIFYGVYFDSVGEGFEIWIEDSNFVSNENGNVFFLNFTINNIFERMIPFHYEIFFYENNTEIGYYIDFISVPSSSQETISVSYSTTISYTHVNFSVDNGITESINFKL